MKTRTSSSLKPFWGMPSTRKVATTLLPANSLLGTILGVTVAVLLDVQWLAFSLIVLIGLAFGGGVCGLLPVWFVRRYWEERRTESVRSIPTDTGDNQGGRLAMGSRQRRMDTP